MCASTFLVILVADWSYQFPQPHSIQCKVDFKAMGTLIGHIVPAAAVDVKSGASILATENAMKTALRKC